MLSHNDPRVYGKEEAYCLLKNKLQIPKTAPVFKEFFDLFFYQTGELVCYALMDEVQIDNFFQENKITETNKRIFEIRKHHPILARSLYNNALFALKSKLSVP